MRKRIIALFLTVILSVSVLAGCAAQQEPATKDSVTVKNEELYFSTQEVRESPKWVTDLEATKDAEQLIVVAGVGETTLYAGRHLYDRQGVRTGGRPRLSDGVHQGG